MARITLVNINGFKKIKEMKLELNENLNIIVGDNESGKSTILEAISLVLNQNYRSSEKVILKELFNLDNVKKFEINPKFENLPVINIDIHFDMNREDGSIANYFGRNNLLNIDDYGISFKCEFNENFKDQLITEIEKGNIPYEYYELSWNTFAGLPYNQLNKVIKYIAIDNTRISSTGSMNYYNKSMFNNILEVEQISIAKNEFYKNIKDTFDDLELPTFDDDQKFGVNFKRINLENILAIYKGDIAIENMGKGIESILKIKNAINRVSGKIDIISIEEPENHLSHVNLRKMIKEISENSKNSQVIITTHNSLIASGLGLNNSILLSDYKNEIKHLNFPDIDGDTKDDTVDFFIKADSYNILQFILSKKVILVEGNTEFILLPKIFEDLTGESLDENNIHVISCSGISYKRYLKISEILSKKTAVLTDNDKNKEKINLAKKHNNELISIYMDDSIDNWTWEVSLYSLNKEVLDKHIETQKASKYLYMNIDYGKTLGYMLNNKAESAYRIVSKNVTLNYPKHVKEMIEWIRK